MTDNELLQVLETQNRVHQEREYIVAKSNRLAERARQDLSISELRLLSYLLSKVQPDDTAETSYEISIRQFLRVCGLSAKSGGNYEAVKNAIEVLWSKHFWMRDESGREIGVQWVMRPILDQRAGTVSVRLDPSVQQYVLDLIRYGRYFQYRLLCVLPMRSAYSVRLYEALKAGSYRKKKLLVDLDDLRRILSCTDIYGNFKDLRRRVLDTACNEINAYTDLFVRYEPVYSGRRVAGIEFTVRQRHAAAVSEIYENNHQILDSQLTLADYLG